MRNEHLGRARRSGSLGRAVRDLRAGRDGLFLFHLRRLLEVWRASKELAAVRSGPRRILTSLADGILAGWGLREESLKLVVKCPEALGSILTDATSIELLATLVECLAIDSNAGIATLRELPYSRRGYVPVQP